MYVIYTWLFAAPERFCGAAGFTDCFFTPRTPYQVNKLERARPAVDLATTSESRVLHVFCRSSSIIRRAAACRGSPLAADRRVDGSVLSMTETGVRRHPAPKTTLLSASGPHSGLNLTKSLLCRALHAVLGDAVGIDDALKLERGKRVHLQSARGQGSQSSQSGLNVRLLL